MDSALGGDYNHSRDVTGRVLPSRTLLDRIQILQIYWDLGMSNIIIFRFPYSFSYFTGNSHLQGHAFFGNF